MYPSCYSSRINLWHYKVTTVMKLVTIISTYHELYTHCNSFLMFLEINIREIILCIIGHLQVYTCYTKVPSMVKNGAQYTAS